MNPDIKNVGIYNENFNFEIDVKESQINYSNTITEKDFTKKPISYFYENIFVDLGKRSAGKLDVSPKWRITFDQKCAPIDVSYLPANYRNSQPKFTPFEYKHSNKKFYHRYGTIDINGKPIFYYIYFPLQEIIDVIK